MLAILKDLGTLAIFSGVISLAVAAIVVSRRSEGQHDRTGDALWDDLRKAHDLSRREAKYLRTMAERASLDPESLIFLEPHVLMRLADKDARSQGEVRELMSKLYS